MDGTNIPWVTWTVFYSVIAAFGLAGLGIALLLDGGKSLLCKVIGHKPSHGRYNGEPIYEGLNVVCRVQKCVRCRKWYVCPEDGK